MEDNNMTGENTSGAAGDSDTISGDLFAEAGRKNAEAEQESDASKKRRAKKQKKMQKKIQKKRKNLASSADGKKKRRIHPVTAIILVLLLLIGGIVGTVWYRLYSDKVEIVDVEDVDPTDSNVRIAKQDQIDPDVYNILLVGTDSRDPDSDQGRSDSMMLISFNKQKNTTTAISFLRDTLVPIDGYGQSRLGHTYAYGGVGLTINTINQVYDLDVQNYITISFEDLVSVIDEIGGVTVTITEEEAEYYQQAGMKDVYAGQCTLTGSQALAHARNRTLGSDFERTRRQRDVMYGIYNKVTSSMDASSVMSLISFAMNHVNTNMSVGDLYSMAQDVMSAEGLDLQQAGIPTAGTYESITYNGMAVLQVDFDANIEYIHNLLY